MQIRTRIGILGHPLIMDQLRVVAEEFRNMVEIRLVDWAFFSDAVSLAHQWEADSAVDVFVTGGANAELLRKEITLPVVEFRLNSVDLLTAVSRAAETSPVVPVVTYAAPIPSLDKVLHLFRANVMPISYEDRSQLPAVMNRLHGQGARAVVGSTTVCQAALAAGMEGILIYSLQSFREAIVSALDLAAARQRELERAERLKAILDFAYSGIVATDESGQITVFNPVAEKITGIGGRSAVGRPLEEVLGSECTLLAAVRDRKSISNQVHRIARSEVLASHVPIGVEGQIRGSVIMFQEAAVLEREVVRVRERLAGRGLQASHRLGDVIGQSQVMQMTVDKATRYARSDSTILIQGETGTGKELFAQGIHNASRRHDGPFVVINCAALPETLLESELFGYEDGAFTGARKGGKAGLFELANRGTIFLDEIGEISPGLQASLLRVVQQREVMRVSGDRVIPVDVRVISATHRNLRADVEEGRFRRDLYFRLDVLHLHLPPLRERLEDLPLLVAASLSRFDPEVAEGIRPLMGRIVPIASRYCWTGNVREIENLVERFAVTVQGSSLSPRESLERLIGLLEEYIDRSGTVLPATPPVVRKSERTSMMAITRELTRTNGNHAEAARRLGISRTTLYRKLSGQK